MFRDHLVGAQVVYVYLLHNRHTPGSRLIQENNTTPYKVIYTKWTSKNDNPAQVVIV